VQQVGDLIAEIARRGVAILLVEQKLSIAMRISHRVYVMGHGRVVFEGTPAELKTNDAVRKEWLEVSASDAAEQDCAVVSGQILTNVARTAQCRSGVACFALRSRYQVLPNKRKDRETKLCFIGQGGDG
jgi:ABC-type multidrug transport system ATPase subunit